MLWEHRRCGSKPTVGRNKAIGVTQSNDDHLSSEEGIGVGLVEKQLTGSDSPFMKLFLVKLFETGQFINGNHFIDIYT